MTKRISLLTAIVMLTCGLSMNATASPMRLPMIPSAKQVATAPAPGKAFIWNFIYAFGNGAVSGLSWSSNYLTISSGNYVVYSANGYGFLTPSSPVYCNAVDNANTYVQVWPSGGGASTVSYYDFQDY